MDPTIFEDKDLDFFSLPPETQVDGFFESNFFSNLDSLGSSDTSNESHLFDELSLGSASRDSESNQGRPGPTKQQQPNRAWATKSWRAYRAPPVPTSQKHVHRLRHDGVGISSIELLSLEGKRQQISSSLASSTPPSTPPSTLFKRPSSPVTPSPAARAKGTPSRTLRRTATGLPKTMHSANCKQQSGPSTVHEWDEGFQHFKFRAPSSLPLSPPYSGRLVQHEQPSRLAIPPSDDIFGPIAGTEAAESSATSSSRSAGDPYGNGRPFNLPDRTLNLQPSPPSDFPFGHGDLWETVNGFGSVLGDDHDLLGSERSTQFFDCLDPSLAGSGLMIQCDPFDSLGGGLGPGGSSGFADGTMAANSASFDANKHTGETHSPPTHAGFSRRARPALLTSALPRPLSRSPSPSPSPATAPTTPRTPAPRRQRSTPCIVTTGGTTTRITRAPRTPKTPKTPKAGGGRATSAGAGRGGGDPFHNFTPADSTKILSGVAPSGSSKTKARREREALEQQRKLSEAAALYVKSMGGDADRFRKEALLEEGEE